MAEHILDNIKAEKDINPDYNVNGSSSIYAYSKAVKSTQVDTDLTDYDFVPNPLYTSSYPIFRSTKATSFSVTANSFTIDDVGSTFNFGTFLIVEPQDEKGVLPSDNITDVSLYLKFNSNTIDTLPTLPIDSSISESTIYLVVEAIQSTIGNDGTSDNQYAEKSAIISYDVNGDKTLSNPQIVASGCFSTDYEYSFTNTGIMTDNNSNFKLWASSIDTVVHNRSDIRGLPKAAVVKIKRKQPNLSSIYSSSSFDAVLSLDFGLQPDTVTITGGSNYVVGETFTITGSATRDGEITITKVSDSGAILSTKITNNGLNFTTNLTVTYNGSIGGLASITKVDAFRLFAIKVTDGGVGYLSQDEVEFYRNASATEPMTLETEGDQKALFTIKTKPIGVEPPFKHEFSIEKIRVNNGGNNHVEAPKVSIVQNGRIIENTYISSNKANFSLFNENLNNQSPGTLYD